MSTPRWAVYPTQPAPLAKQIDDLLEHAPATPHPGTVVALVVPDSNRLAGGPAAAAAYKLLAGQDIDTVLIVSPSHTESFERLSICRVDSYHSPLGDLPINDTLRNELCDEDDDIFIDDRGHYHTEGVDAQLPFLQRVLPHPFDIVPVVMGDESMAFCKELGAAIGEVMYGRRALLVVTADVLTADAASFNLLTDALNAFNISEVMHLMAGDNPIRIEGMGAVVVAMIAAQERGARRAEMLHYTPPQGEEMGAFSLAFWRD